MDKLIVRVKERIYAIQTLDEMVRIARERELRKRKQGQDPTLPVVAKRFKHANSSSKGQKGPQHSMCRKSHKGTCCASVC